MRLNHLLHNNYTSALLVLAVGALIFQHVLATSAENYCEFTATEGSEQLVYLQSQRSTKQGDELLLGTEAGQKLLAIVPPGQVWQTGAGYRIGYEVLPKRELKPGEFDYDKYLRQRGVCARLELKQWHLVSEPGPLNKLEYLLSQVRGYLGDNITQRFGQPTEGLALALVLGDTSRLGSDLEAGFKEMGIIHLLAISGANFALILDVWGRLFVALPQRQRFWAQLALATLYIGIVGVDNLAAARAYMFLILGQFAKYSGRRLKPERLLLLALVALLLAKPYAYLDLGLQLSLTAWVVVKLFLSRLLPLVSRQESFVRDEIVAAMLGTFMLMPVSLLFFGKINLLSGPYNAVAAPIFSLLNLIFAAVAVLPPWEPPVLGSASALLDIATAQVLAALTANLDAVLPISASSVNGKLFAGFAGFIYLSMIVKYVRDQARLHPIAQTAV